LLVDNPLGWLSTIEKYQVVRNESIDCLSVRFVEITRQGKTQTESATAYP